MFLLERRPIYGSDWFVCVSVRDASNMEWFRSSQLFPVGCSLKWPPQIANGQQTACTPRHLYRDIQGISKVFTATHLFVKWGAFEAIHSIRWGSFTESGILPNHEIQNAADRWDALCQEGCHNSASAIFREKRCTFVKNDYRTEVLYQTDPEVKLKLPTTISRKHQYCMRLGVEFTGHHLHRIK